MRMPANMTEWPIKGGFSIILTLFGMEIFSAKVLAAFGKLLLTGWNLTKVYFAVRKILLTRLLITNNYYMYSR